MFENASLQELYTGSLIAGKGRHLNNINQIMTKNKFRIEDWVRVRFGAGTPWRRCWCVIDPPDEKEWLKAQKRLSKKSAYEKPTYPKGDIKFYDTKKIKKASPLATITDAYSAYAIYPQSKPLMNESTLVKLEGKITIHSSPESKTEGFVFVMPEVHPAVSGFEMMLRWLLPVYDTFSLYGRPARLIPDTLDTRSLMFAMPKERRYGYLDIIDVAALIHTEGSDKWTEREWRKQMKNETSRRMNMQVSGRSSNVDGPRPHQRTLMFDDGSSARDPSLGRTHKYNQSTDAVFEPPRKSMTTPALAHNYHSRSASETVSLASPARPRTNHIKDYTPSRLTHDYSPGPEYTENLPIMSKQRPPLASRADNLGYQESTNSSDSESFPQVDPNEVHHDMTPKPVQPVVAPPEFQHNANEAPRKRPLDRPELRREKSRMSDATLAQMNPRALEQLRKENNATPEMAAANAAAIAWNSRPVDQTQNRGVTSAPAVENGENTNQVQVQRPAMVAHSSSTSLQSVKRRPVPSTSIDVAEAVPVRPETPRLVSTESRYSDREGTASPGYSSGLADEPQEMERIRGGVRRTVGDTNMSASQDFDVNFGVTPRLTPENSRPTTPQPGGRNSPFASLGRPATSNGRLSPFDSLGYPGRQPEMRSYAAPTPPQTTPERLVLNETRSPSRTNPPGRVSHSRSNSYAWQPNSVPNENVTGLSAEDFVAHRAALASRPQGYAVPRVHSSGRVEQLKQTALEAQWPASPTSPKKLQKPRPSSRQSSHNSIDYSSHLTAREREHVARVTGGKLVNVVDERRVPDPNVGLIGAIEAREQEKRNIKDGVQGHLVQAAIASQQREQAGHVRSHSQMGAYIPTSMGVGHSAGDAMFNTVPPTYGQGNQYNLAVQTQRVAYQQPQSQSFLQQGYQYPLLQHNERQSQLQQQQQHQRSQSQYTHTAHNYGGYYNPTPPTQ